MIRIGDLVTVNNPKLKSHDMTGSVHYTDQFTAYVKLENGRFNEFRLDNLVKAEEQPVMKSQNSDKKFLATLYMHDGDANPQSMEELWRDRDSWFLAEPQDVFYGTRDEIREWVENHQEIGGYENAFVIIDSEIYHINTQVHLKGF